VGKSISGACLSYTAHRNPDIDETIQQHMEIIVDELVKAVSHIDSIVLSGGFGHGEGCVRRLPNGKYLPMNDYDVYVFSDAEIPYDLFQGLRKRVQDKIDLEEKHHRIRVDIKFIRTSKLTLLLPDMWSYELKSARVIWGKDLRNLIPLEKEDVPLTVGLNTLLLTAGDLITYFEPQYLDEEIPLEVAETLDYSCTRAFLQVCLALLLLGGFYESYYSRRAELFSKHYTNSFPELSAILPDLPQKVRYHTNLRLRSVNFGPKHPIKLWFEARNVLKYALWYFVCRILGKPFNIEQDFVELLVKNGRKLASFYFEPYLRYALRRIGVPSAPTLLKILMPAVHAYENLRYVRNCSYNTRKVFFSPLPRLQSPLMNIYLSFVLLLLSVEEDGREVRKGPLREAYRLMKSMFPCKYMVDNKWETWRSIRDACSSAFKVQASSPQAMTL